MNNSKMWCLIDASLLSIKIKGIDVWDVMCYRIKNPHSHVEE